MEKEYVNCTNCNCEIEEEESFEYQGENYCQECKDELFIKCYHCDEYILENESICVENNDYCQDCIDSLTVTCVDCLELILQNSANDIGGADAFSLYHAKTKRECKEYLDRRIEELKKRTARWDKEGEEFYKNMKF